MQNKSRVLLIVLLVLLAAAFASVRAQDEAPAAEIENDEGGPVVVTGSLAYTNPFFTAGVSEPIIITEDQTGFVNRDRQYIMPVASQTLGQITSDFFTSPFSYSLTLPEVPAGGYNDVDNDSEAETGVQVFAIAFWTNTWGDPYLDVRDLHGGGWSSAYVSTRVNGSSQVGEAGYEWTGGKILVYTAEDEQGFPSGFGDDGFLFTEDDPIVLLPPGYTVVDMDSDPFIFDRSETATIDLIEGEGAAADDFSDMSYTEAFDAMVDKFEREYAFTEYKDLDWDDISDEFRPLFEQAEEDNDVDAYLLALRDFLWSVPDGHVGGTVTTTLSGLFIDDTDGGLGIAIRDVDDGGTIVNYVLERSPADDEGIELGAEILEINGDEIDDVVEAAVPWSSPFSSPHVRRLQQLRYAMRFPVDEDVEVTYQNPDDDEPTTATLTAIAERDSFAFSSFNQGRTGIELPLEYSLLDSGYMYVKIYSFLDNELLTIQLWERMLAIVIQNDIPGIIIDMRQNGGGSGFLADQMAAYFFDDELDLGNTGYYDSSTGQFEFDPNQEEYFILPPENLYYSGPVAVIVGPACASACEFFSYDMSINDRAFMVGQYPTQGLGGSVERFFMPEGEVVQMTIGRAVDADGDIHIEGLGVPPTVQVPVTAETLLSESDAVLDAAVDTLGSETGAEVGTGDYTITDGGTLRAGDEVTGEVGVGERVQYQLRVKEDEVISIFVEDESGNFDTYLRIYDEDGNLIAENDDAESGDTLNSAIEELEIPEDLTLIVEVGTYNDSDEGEYTLRVEKIED
jgi:C-terminal processing protease CtpA/Prc